MTKGADNLSYKNFEERCELAIRSLQLCQAHDDITVTRLSGGVASDIAAVAVQGRMVCVKFALDKLRVEVDWFAPVHRSQAEFAWLSVANRVVPNAVPKLYGWSEAANGFAMEYIDGNNVSNWKEALLSGVHDDGESRSVATIIGRVHAESSAPGFDRSAFENMNDFESLRIDPYLRYTALKHPDHASLITSLANGLAQSTLALVHGDVSPKNILLRSGQPILLDAECATMGDPAFDVAFYLNHLMLKSLHLPHSCLNLLESAQQFWSAYADQITWEAVPQMQARVVALLPALMLARVDGKSPAEYLSDNTRDKVRQIALKQLNRPTNSLQDLIERLKKETLG